MAKAPQMIPDSLIKLPLPTNISYWWNYGSLLGLLLTLQLTSGIMLSMHYCPNTVLAFSSIIHIMQNVNQGWLLHNTHVSGASLFFISMYTHIGRGIYYHSFTMRQTWFMGVLIFMTSMATAFLGYVLPWGQMSFWGATVITNLVTTTPMIGQLIVEWIWGGFAIDNATLNRFFSFHFLLPFFMITMVVMHLIFLHSSGSKNPLGINSNLNKVMFHPLFTIKDTLGFTLMLATLMMINLQHPYMFNDPENFTQANPLITPLHIQPEWYFLFAYAILRSIPNKLGGVLALLMAILILYSLQWNKPNMSNKFYPISQIMFWMFSNIFLMLTFMGTQMIEYPYMNLSQILAILYFSFFPLYSLSAKLWDKMMKTLL